MTVFNSTNIDTTISDDLKQYFSVRKRYVDCIMNGDDSVSNVTDLLSAVEALTRMCPICVNYSGKSLGKLQTQKRIGDALIIDPDIIKLVIFVICSKCNIIGNQSEIVFVFLFIIFLTAVV